jgi:putative hydrolase of HD superfamily
MKNEAQAIYNFIEYAEGLKRELRHTWLTDERREDAAEHSWRMALMAILIAPKTSLKLDLEKVLKLIAIHDIIEIEARDVPAVKHMTNNKIADDKKTNELLAIGSITSLLEKESGDEISNLWHEYEDNETMEANFANIMDKLEARIQKSQQPKKMLTKDEYDLEFINKYSDKMTELCMGDELLLELDKIAREKRIMLTAE